MNSMYDSWYVQSPTGLKGYRQDDSLRYDYEWFRAPKTTVEIPNPIGQPLTVTWQEDGKIQYRGCKDYEELEKVVEENWSKEYLKIVRSVQLSYGEVGVLAANDRIKRTVEETRLAHEKKVKEEKEADEKEYLRLKEKLCK